MRGSISDICTSRSGSMGTYRHEHDIPHQIRVDNRQKRAAKVADTEDDGNGVEGREQTQQSAGERERLHTAASTDDANV